MYIISKLVIILFALVLSFGETKYNLLRIFKSSKNEIFSAYVSNKSFKKRKRKNSNNSKSRQTVNYSGISKQCKGQTQSGSRCSRMTKNDSGKCWQH